MHNPFQDLTDKLNSIEGMLLEIKQSTLQPINKTEIELLDAAQAAVFLRLTTQTVYDKIHNGTLPHVKQGNRVYFFKDELIEWLKSGRPKTIDQLTTESKESIARTITARRRKGKSNDTQS